MPEYKLKYFNFRGRAELPRLMFAEAGQCYEDIRIEQEDWPKEKPKTPFGLLPVLFIDDTPLPQTGAIVRFLAKSLKLEPENNLQNAFADMIFETIHEALFEKIRVPFMEKDEVKKAELLSQWFEKDVAPVFIKLEKKFAEEKTDFFIGQKLSYVDLALMNCFMTLEGMKPGFTDDYPALKELSERVQNRPNIKKWLDTRPITPF